MFTKKTLVSALIAAGALGAAALPLPSAAAGFDISSAPRTRARMATTTATTAAATVTSLRASTGTATGYPIALTVPNGTVRISDRDRDGVPDRFDRYPDNPRWR